MNGITVENIVDTAKALVKLETWAERVTAGNKNFQEDKENCLDFDGQVVIVTGSGSPKRNRQDHCQDLRKQNAAVVIADMNEAGVQDTVN